MPGSDRKWILVTGAALDLTLEEQAAATQVGLTLGRAGYGLIVGDWDGVDWLVRDAFLKVVAPGEQAARIKHNANYKRRNLVRWLMRIAFPKVFSADEQAAQIKHDAKYNPWDLVRIAGAVVLPNDGGNGTYSQSAVNAADAGIIVSGRKGSKPSMDALLQQGKPVLPVPFLGYDAFEVYVDMLRHWAERPVPGLTERQFLELMKPWQFNPQLLLRTLRASLTSEPEIFISYRRDDVPTAAGRLFDELAHAYGERAVFIDYMNLGMGSAIEGIITQLKHCKVLIAIIGPTWESARLAAPEDYVRRELEVAHESRMRVIPLLVGRTAPPHKEALPESLKYLWGLLFSKIQMDDWRSGVEKLVKAVDQALLESNSDPQAASSD